MRYRITHQSGSWEDNKLIGQSIRPLVVISFLWSTASLLIFSLLPAYLTEELGVSNRSIGLMEGIVILSSFLTKFISGVQSDVIKKRRPFIVWGTFFSAIVKVLFVIGNSFTVIFWARFVDRLVKGIRSAPSDALLADLSKKSLYGKNYYYRQAYYTLGAVVGSLAATVLMYWSKNNYKLVFSVSFFVGLLACYISLFYLKDANVESRTNLAIREKNNWSFGDIKKLPISFWILILITFLLMLGRFSEAFLTLRAKSVGIPIAYLPMIIVVMDLFHVACSMFFGKVVKDFGEERLLVIGLCIFAFAHLVFFQFSSIQATLIGVILVGIHMGMTQGVLRSIIAKVTPRSLRGTSFAIFYLVSGISVFISNYCAGVISDTFGLAYIFLMGAFFVGIAMLLYVLYLSIRSRYVPRENVKVAS